jgi:beta-glucanase (GH16 family)
MKKTISLWLTATLIIASTSCSKDDPKQGDSIDLPEGYELLWNDEFNDDRIDPLKWTYETGDGTDYGLPRGWGNNELQLYTSSEENSHIGQDGDVSALIITAKNDGDNQYTSAKLTTKGLFSMRFGRIDIKAKLPEGKGIWPAIWMMGDNRDMVDWPGCGEIDIMEMLGHEPDKVYGTVHYVNEERRKGDSQGMHVSSSQNFSDGYHVFTLVWTPETLRFEVDGIHYHEVTIEEDMKEFLRSFYLILNVAVGGYWPGYPDATTAFPQSMHVDYVRVFSRKGFTPPAPPTLNVEEESIGQVIEPNIADHAIREGFEDLGNLEVISYGGGGEPFIATSENAIDGDLSLVFDFPGGNWGGAYLLMEQPRNLSQYTHLVFSLNKPADLVDAEIKLESPSSNASVFLTNYQGSEISDGFFEYAIPLSDFQDLDLIQVNIPFAIWNPVNGSGEFVTATVLIDNVHFLKP